MRSLRSSSRTCLTKKETTSPAKFVIVEYVDKSNSGDKTLFEVVAVGIIRGSHTIDSRVSYLPPNTKCVNGGARKMRRGKVRGHYETRSDAQTALQRFEDEQLQLQNNTLRNDNEPSTSTTTKLLAAAILQEKEINRGLDQIPELDLNINIKVEADSDFLSYSLNDKPKTGILGPPTLVNEGRLDADQEDYDCKSTLDCELSAQFDDKKDDNDSPDKLQMETDGADCSSYDVNSMNNNRVTFAMPPPSLTPVHRHSLRVASKHPSTASQWTASKDKPTLAEALADIPPMTTNAISAADGLSTPPTVRQILNAVLENQLLIIRHLGKANNELLVAEQKTREMLAANNKVTANLAQTPANGRSRLRPVKFTSTSSSTTSFSAPYLASDARRIIFTNAVLPSSVASGGDAKKVTFSDALRIPTLRVIKPRVGGFATPQDGGGQLAKSPAVEEARPRTSATASIASTTPICLSHFQNGMPLLKDSTSPELEFDEKTNDDDNAEIVMKPEQDEEGDGPSNIFSDLPPLKPET